MPPNPDFQLPPNQYSLPFHWLKYTVNLKNNNCSYPQIDESLSRCFSRCCNSFLSFFIFFPLDTKRWRCNACYWKSHSNSKGGIWPWGTTNATVEFVAGKERRKGTKGEWENRSRLVRLGNKKEWCWRHWSLFPSPRLRPVQLIAHTSPKGSCIALGWRKLLAYP